MIVKIIAGLNKILSFFQSFKGICKILGSAISERGDLRVEVMSGLRKLISKSKEQGL